MAAKIENEEELIRKAEAEPPMRPYLQEKLEKDAQRNWDVFYMRNTTNFFKDRHWIHREFPELAPTGDVSVCSQVVGQSLAIWTSHWLTTCPEAHDARSRMRRRQHDIPSA
jgi:hypothetical protein